MGEEGSSERERQRLRILFVEDEETVLTIGEKVLSRSGFEVHVAQNGKKALEFLHSVQVDLVITDLVMPVMGGWEFLEKAKEQLPDRFQEMVVIIITGNVDQIDGAKMAELEVFHALAKPFSVSSLLGLIEKVTAQKFPHLASR